jgi:signal transduction histidine kinase
MTGLKTKLWLAFGSLMGVLLAVSLLSVVVLTRYGQTIEQLYHENFDSVRYCDGMKQALDRLNERALSAAAARDNIEGTIPDMRAFTDNLASESRNTTLSGEAQRVKQLAAAWQQYRAAWTIFQAPAADRAEFYRATLLPAYERLHDLAQSISDMNMANMLRVDGQIRQSLAEVRVAVLLLVLTGTIVSSAIVGGVGASVLRSVRSLTRSARQIESGNLDLAVEVDSTDEIGQLAQAFNSMADKLREFRKADHDRLQRARLTTQIAIDSLPDAVCVISPAGAVEISNRAAERHFRIAPGAKVSELDLPWLTDLCQRVANFGKPIEPAGYRGAIQLQVDNQETFLLPRAQPMRSATGEVLGTVIILVDVTRLRHADELKSGLLSTVSHELRTPLTSIRMGVLMLAEEKLGPLTATQRRSLAAVRDDSDRLHRIIENLLSIGRIEAGAAQIQARRVTAREIVTPAIESIRAAADERNIALTIRLAHDLPDIHADGPCIELALVNLLSNAVKFTPPGGSVVLSVRSIENALEFLVEDTGPGIAPEHAARIFQRFYRAPRKEGPSGAGLGLAIAKEIVETHEGRIWFRSMASGSAFGFSIPALPPNAEPADSAELALLRDAVKT